MKIGSDVGGYASLTCRVLQFCIDANSSNNIFFLCCDRPRIELDLLDAHDLQILITIPYL